MTREDLINYIRKHNAAIQYKQLENLSYASLVIIKVQVEFERYKAAAKKDGKGNKK